MKRNFFNIGIFVLSTCALFISIKLFWNMGVYVDEFNTSLDVVLGGDLALIMDWIRLGILLLISILSGINIFKK
ncbi:hypothetical protein NE172_15015 [Clostridium botulinum]|uniref:Uncharacterized protein n=1 Tax=Clostridium botulinum TaxID=1491 RepID=A0A6B4JJY1_CLOBO|nr:hypothetical protein [Clostridium botulinum]EES50145.1 hypothetical protein CLO_0949 [Clostridium botulinum E1 str. 'BoNT E Beluga']MBY6760119.1 hypothetical protein [Clostridium botulinum]MBY6919028.1 hypothetical protein [Clostridium botulinum]MCR1132249.1 hypothetical protein [Clostridium botulinum]NFJ57328.1 hypothetical protein [Clostridium botulinum]